MNGPILPVDPADMTHCILEEHQVHQGVELVVALEGIVQQLAQALPARDGHVLWLPYPLGEVAEDQRTLQDLINVQVIKVLLENVLQCLVKHLNVLAVSQLVLVDSLNLLCTRVNMYPNP